MWTRATALLCAIVACRGDIAAPEDPADPHLYVLPHAIDFGTIELGETGTVWVTLRNDGDEDLEVDGLVPSSDAVAARAPSGEKTISFTSPKWRASTR